MVTRRTIERAGWITMATGSLVSVGCIVSLAYTDISPAVGWVGMFLSIAVANLGVIMVGDRT